MGPLRVAFFPAFFNLAETSRMVNIARELKALGRHDVIFFSHGGAYESLAEKDGFPIVRVEPTYTEADIDRFWRYDTMESMVGDIFPYPFLKDQVVHEIEAFREAQVSMVVTGFHLPCDLSARASHLPLVWVIPATCVPVYFEAGLATYPDALERRVLRVVPESFKNRAYNWGIRHFNAWVGPFTKVAKDLGIAPVARSTLDLWQGDVTLLSDLREFVGLEPTDAAPAENFVGPLLGNLDLPLEPEIEAHLKKSERSIYFAMGSSGQKELFLRILQALSGTDFPVVAAHTTIVDASELPPLSSNMLVRKLVPAESVSKLAALSIIHGGQGTVYTAAYSGRPAIGIPMQFEQQYNLDCLVRHGCGLRLSKTLFREKDLLQAIGEIFDHYPAYRERALALAGTLRALPKADGAKVAARRIAEISAGNARRQEADTARAAERL